VYEETLQIVCKLVAIAAQWHPSLSPSPLDLTQIPRPFLQPSPDSQYFLFGPSFCPLEIHCWSHPPESRVFF
jgi:hypothetical protein